MAGPGQTCCINTELKRIKTSVIIDDICFDVILVYCNNCGVVRPSGSMICDGNKINEGK